MDFGQIYKNTDYAENLDFEQQLDYEEETNPEVPLDVREHKNFVERCRRAKCNYSTIKRCEQEIERKTSKLKEDIISLENKAEILKSRLVWKPTVKGRKELDNINSQIESKKKLIEDTIIRISNEIFGTPKKK